MPDPLSKKQVEFISNATKKWNLAHGSVRTGKTVCTVFAFMHSVLDCPDSQIYIVGHTFDTAYRNVVRMLLESQEMLIFRPFLTWSGKKLYFKDKIITVLGAKDEGAVGNFQGLTMSRVYCDEMTLYPESIIDMIDTRLSLSHSMGFAAMNPSHPKHKIKKWIDLAEEGDSNYYALHFTMDDTPYVDDAYKIRIRNSSSGVFYKRNYLGLWCLAEGAIFDFWDEKIYVKARPPAAADYWVAGIDYGASNPFACLLIGVCTGKNTQSVKVMWVEQEYYWDHKKREKQKTNLELAKDVQEFLQDYDVKSIYIDPSAASFKTELRKLGMRPIDANNDVEEGIYNMTSEMKRGMLYVCEGCKNTIREIESYVWDSKASEKGYDEPLKRDDHAIDALRYVINTHKIQQYKPYEDRTLGFSDWNNRYGQRRF